MVGVLDAVVTGEADAETEVDPVCLALVSCVWSESLELETIEDASPVA